MASVFQGNSQGIGGAIKAEHVKLSGTGFASGTGAVVQQLQIQFERSMNMLYEIGSQNVYYVGDRRRGTIQGSRIVAGSGDFKTMIATYGDMCKAHENDMEIRAEADLCAVAGRGVLLPNVANVNYNCKGVVLVNIGASVTAQDIVITESVGFQFVELEYA